MAQFKDTKRNTWYFKCYTKNGKQILRRGFPTKRDARVAEVNFIESIQYEDSASFLSVQLHHRQSYIKQKKRQLLIVMKVLLNYIYHLFLMNLTYTKFINEIYFYGKSIFFKKILAN